MCTTQSCRINSSLASEPTTEDCDVQLSHSMKPAFNSLKHIYVHTLTSKYVIWGVITQAY